MKIIALQGKGKRGKSTTLKIFLKELLEKYSTMATEFSLNSITEIGLISAKILADEISNENVAINPTNNVKNHTVSFELNGQKIGLTTYGDTQWHIEQAIHCLADCEIVFCACRTKGEGYNYLYNQYKSRLYLLGKASFWSKDTTLSQYFIEYTNKKQVEMLWQILNNII